MWKSVAGKLDTLCRCWQKTIQQSLAYCPALRHTCHWQVDSCGYDKCRKCFVGDSENEKPLTALFMTPVRQCIVLVWLHFPLDKVITSFHWRSVAGKAAQDGYETGEQVWKGKKSPPRKRVMLQLQHGFVGPHSRGPLRSNSLPHCARSSIYLGHTVSMLCWELFICKPLGCFSERMSETTCSILQPVTFKIFQSIARH